MGYWPSYLGVGYGDVLRPYFADSGMLLFNAAVVVATLLVPGLAIAALGALPMLEGNLVDLTWKRIPAAWTEAGRGLDRDLPPNSRSLILPAQAFAFYRWGATVDPILPTVTDRPVAVRNVPPYDD